jgi:hypothetical protein
VLAGTDCGFDTAAGMGRVAEDVVWAKLKALADGARIASERLFPARSSPSARARLGNPDRPKSAPQAPPEM